MLHYIPRENKEMSHTTLTVADDFLFDLDWGRVRGTNYFLASCYLSWRETGPGYDTV